MGNWKACSILAIVLAVTVGTGTAQARNFNAAAENSPSASFTSGYSWLRISAFVNVPLAGADVAVYDNAGNLLFQQDNATNDQGVFPAHIDDLPRNFRVDVTFNGNAQQDRVLGSLGEFTLSADVRNFDPVHGIVYVNPATALVSRVMDRLPEHDLSDARYRVRRFLGLPRNASLGAALRESASYRSPYFSETAFAMQAVQYGGIETVLNEISLELLKPKFPTHSFAGAAAPPGDVFNFIATNLAAGALAYFGGQGVGWVLGSGGKPAQPGVTPAQIAQLQTSLNDLQSSVDNLNKQLQVLTQEVKAKLTENRYNQIVVPALALGLEVNGVESDLSFFAAGCPPIVATGDVSSNQPFEDFCSSRRGVIKNELEQVTINHSFNVLSGYLLDNNGVGFKGMIHLYSESLGEQLRFFRPADSTKLLEMYNYWYGVQTQAANLQVELLHLDGAQTNIGGIAELRAFLGDVNGDPPALGTFQQTLIAEQRLVFPAVPIGTVVDTQSRLMWYTDDPAGGVVGCGGAPPAESVWNYPATTAVNINGMNWLSPTVAQAQTLIAGWTGASVNQWLTDQTQAVAPDMPLSPGFADTIHLPNNCMPAGIVATGDIWTRDPTGKTLDAFGKQYSTNYYLSLRKGTFHPNPKIQYDSGAPVGSWFGYFWEFLVRDLKSGEQYYWYPSN